jgi:5-methyltetrahydropteroyltriglutamate--homocysteine methyltransferase
MVGHAHAPEVTFVCTPRAGDMDVLRGLRDDQRIGVGVGNQKHARVEAVDEILVRAREAIGLFGVRRVLLTPDCNFATFADNPLASASAAEQKLAAIARAAQQLRAAHRLATA